MELVAYGLAALLGVLGLLFVMAAGQGNTVVRVAVGVLCWAAAGAIVMLTRVRPKEITHRQEIDLSGDVSLEQLTCRQCGGTLGRDSIRVEAGAVFVHCEYCGAHYQLEEAPRW